MSRFLPDERIDTIKIDLECLRDRVDELDERLAEDLSGRMTPEQFEEKIKKIVDAQLAAR